MNAFEDVFSFWLGQTLLLVIELHEAHWGERHVLNYKWVRILPLKFMSYFCEQTWSFRVPSWSAWYTVSSWAGVTMAAAQVECYRNDWSGSTYYRQLTLNTHNGVFVNVQHNIRNVFNSQNSVTLCPREATFWIQVFWLLSELWHTVPKICI